MDQSKHRPITSAFERVLFDDRGLLNGGCCFFSRPDSELRGKIDYAESFAGLPDVDSARAFLSFTHETQ
jgi:hypothetical protein